MFDRVQVFSATKAYDRRNLGVLATEWIRDYKGEIVDKVVVQSSDREFHCLTIVLFGKDALKRTRNGG